MQLEVLTNADGVIIYTFKITFLKILPAKTTASQLYLDSVLYIGHLSFYVYVCLYLMVCLQGATEGPSILLCTRSDR